MCDQGCAQGGKESWLCGVQGNLGGGWGWWCPYKRCMGISRGLCGNASGFGGWGVGVVVFEGVGVLWGAGGFGECLSICKEVSGVVSV